MDQGMIIMSSKEQGYQKARVRASRERRAKRSRRQRRPKREFSKENKE
jgi:hypothetical protein